MLEVYNSAIKCYKGPMYKQRSDAYTHIRLFI